LRVINEIKALNVHTWWGLCVSDRIADLIWGKGRPVVTPEQHENDEEVYMALFQESALLGNEIKGEIRVRPVRNLDEFGIWTDICNAVLHNGYAIMHRVNHFHLCEKGIMPCYIGFYSDKPVAVSAILNNHGISSLEFVATLADYRRKGLAKALITTAVNKAIDNGAKIITTRAFADAKNIYKSVGFKVYYI
jgi:GNAT superfamily N-acetyltransferase